MNSKQELRLIAKNIRKSLDMPKLSEKLSGVVQEHQLYKEAKNVMIFYPAKYEVNMLSLLNDDKNFYLPRVTGQNFEVCPYKIGDDLNKSSFNILEPVSDSVSADLLDLVIVPALMADRSGFRLGYGGGYYDRFLKRFGKNFKTITVLPKELFVNKLPTDGFDIPVNVVISN